MEILLKSHYMQEVTRKEALLKARLQHPAIVHAQSAGLWMSLQFKTPELNQAIVHACVRNGLITDWFVFAPDRLRIAPPLIITDDELEEVCNRLLYSIQSVTG